MSSATLPEAAAAYLAALERELADLPADERAELLEEIEASLLEAGDDPEATLGTPARFAAELRASAGLAPPPTAPALPRESAWTRLKRDPAFRSALATARELEPIWWAARAYIVLAAFTVGTRETYAVPFPRLSGFRSLDIALVALAVASSIALGFVGRRFPGRLRALRIALNLAAVACLILLPEFVDRSRGGAEEIITVPAPAVSGLANSGQRVENVYPYDRRGRLLHDVRLFDQNGTPLSVGAGDNDPNRRLVETRTGRVVFNAFPIRYFDPGTRTVAHPNAVPHDLQPRPLR
jgi:HAAS domain-containing protein